jgi:hypothetical protein
MVRVSTNFVENSILGKNPKKKFVNLFGSLYNPILPEDHFFQKKNFLIYFKRDEFLK